MPHNTLQSKLNTECSMIKFDRNSLGKRICKFLSKMFWHLNQPVPNYSSINHYRSTAKDGRRSRASVERQSKKTIKQNRLLYVKQHRKPSLAQRNSILMSIEEENETELDN